MVLAMNIVWATPVCTQLPVKAEKTALTSAALAPANTPDMLFCT
jgi:hypothetical protein